jgi:hypothetical protein
MVECLETGIALSQLSIHHLPRHLGSNLFVEKGGILRRGSSGLYRLQPALVCCVRTTIESICDPRKKLPLQWTPD